jgi:class 3 adenylate cyclase
MSIKSKLLAMLLAVSAVSIAVVASWGYYSSYTTLRDAVFNQLTSVRASRARQIEAYFENLREETEVIGLSTMVSTAMRDFIGAYGELETVAVDPSWDVQLKDFYTDEFLPRLAAHIEGSPVIEQYLPTRAAARYLQHQFIAANPHPVGEKQQLTEIPGDTAYGRAHARYHPSIRRVMERLGYYDLLLIDIESGDIVYNISKETDFATNLIDGPYDTSNLAELFRALRRTPDRNLVRVVDFAHYRPSYARPAGFIATPVFDGPRAIGIMALQLSIDELDRVMTGDQQWQRDGLGKTGETILIGPDHLMRSDSRFVIEDPEGYAQALRAAGRSEAQIERVLKLRTSILEQAVYTVAADEALHGRSGTGVIVGNRGVETLASWAPLQLPDLHWAIVAKMDLREAYAPIRKLARGTLVGMALIMLVITVIVMLLARAFVRPVNELIDRVRRAGSGEADVQFDTGSKDEIGELASSLQELAQSVHKQARVIEDMRQEKVRLLESVLPKSIAQRLIRGEEKEIAERVTEASILFAQLRGLTELCDARPPETLMAVLNEIVSAFDDAAAQLGVDKIKTLGGTYLAASGLCAPVLDPARRAVDLARELQHILRRVNAEHRLELTLGVGIALGPVVAGVVGHHRFSYEACGDTVAQAHAALEQAAPGEIVVTTAVRYKVGDVYGYRSVDASDPDLPLWVLQDPTTRAEA